MSVGFSIVPAGPRHAAGILSCLEQAFAPVREQYTEGAWRDTVMSAEALADRFRTMALFVALDPDGRVVGTLGCQAGEGGVGHLRGMAVLPDWQGAGVAQALLGRAEQELRARRCVRVTLDTTEPLRRAIRFYERNGYRATGGVMDFFGMPLYEYQKDGPS